MLIYYTFNYIPHYHTQMIGHQVSHLCPVSISPGIIPETEFKWNCHHLKLIARRNVVDRKNRIKGLSRQNNNFIRWTATGQTITDTQSLYSWWRWWCSATKFNWVCILRATRCTICVDGGGGHHNWSNHGLNESRISLSGRPVRGDWLLVVKWFCDTVDGAQS